MTTELTTTNGNLPAANDQFETGLEALGQGDVIIPRLTITQPTTPDISADNVGKFCINITGDYYAAMHLCCLKLAKGRLLWPAEYSKDNEPLCRSHDFINPANDIEGATPMCHTCTIIPGTKDEHHCPYANWGTDKKGKIIPPRCQEVWNMLVLDLETYMPMFLSLKSTSIKPLRKLFSAISILSKAKKIPMWGWSFKAELKLENYDKGKAYVPIFSSPSALSAEEVFSMADIRQQLAGVSLRSEEKQDTPPPAAQDQPYDDQF